MDMVQYIFSTILIVFSIIAPFIGVTAFASIPLIGVFFALYVTNSFTLFLVVAVFSALIIIIFKIIGCFIGTSYGKRGWNRALRTNFKKFDEIEKNGSFLPDGRSWRKEMKKFINMCTALSSEERDQFISALNGTGSKYPYPQDLSARKQIIKTIESYWARKPIQFEYDAQPTMGVHVMAGSGEDYRNNIEYLLKPDSWDKNTTYFAQMAQSYPQAWKKVMVESENEINKLKDFYKVLPSIKDEKNLNFKYFDQNMSDSMNILNISDTMTESDISDLKNIQENLTVNIKDRFEENWIDQCLEEIKKETDSAMIENRIVSEIKSLGKEMNYDTLIKYASGKTIIKPDVNDLEQYLEEHKEEIPNIFEQIKNTKDCLYNDVNGKKWIVNYQGEKNCRILKKSFSI